MTKHKGFFAVLLYFVLAFTIAVSLQSCEKPQLDSIPSDAIFFNEVIYSKGWAQVGTTGKFEVYTNGEEFITSERADSSMLTVWPEDSPYDGYFIIDNNFRILLQREQCVFYTPKELTSEYFVL